ncbi:16S rRNA (adenine(1518)-N(6)/adenine(1519)-N(6))-dimethyltransferase RsmA [Spiroplasma sp. BIUS-1]|uniref:16S rRNA (adenine(1518)-N(6)/adenine(1519)-N(6))- dimethyltransferase RsmA n=1 Tax=Spiroplasma sp. BIUS-1 TaxID=216964 RepID=UPI0013990E4F|nr:16S rRNA (adenine(1518)-N(6)/adenine(1519)-N(6))-dimethyltransferase RsmA [Spiroplasma sp. BIUS-1]QHX37078.1 16S rRNA (adenine1518-N6/adenine1519-N6)-dimethyltransferase [Spiroplasma sp. BIUS-1]
MEFAKKKFGQNFITDKNLINRIIDILDQEEDHLIIEIGPGRGALTKELINRFSKVIAIEIDPDMESILKSEIKSEKFELIIEDCLEVNFKKLIEDNKFKKVSLISNTPYYITSEIIFRTLNVSKFLDKAIFMVQKEVAQRICAKANENNYNNLSVAAQLYSDIKYEFTVNKNMFKPIPKVDSAIISLTFNEVNLKKVNDDAKFVAFVRKLFNNKRKTILNNLSNITNNKEEALNVLDKICLNQNLRPENIDIDKFIEMYNEVY